MTNDMQNRGARPITVVEDGGLQALYHLTGTTAGPAPTGVNPQILQATRDILMDALPRQFLDPFAPATERDAEVLRVMRQAIGEHLERGGPLGQVGTDEASVLGLFDEVLGFGPAQKYLRDPHVQEVKLNGTRILVQEEGSNAFALVPEQFQDPIHVLNRVHLLASMVGVKLDAANPQQTLPLAFGTRMHITIPPCTPANTALICIRRGRTRAWMLHDLVTRHSINDDIAALLSLLCQADCSILIAGETGSGKTALLEALVNSWPGTPHVITIEDNALEIVVRHPVWTQLAVQTSVEHGAFGRAAKEALRQTPDIVAPGETRAEEAGAILSLAVSGHTVLTTIHAQSCAQAVQRFANCAAMPGAYMYEGRRDDALVDTCAGFDVVIHIEKFGGQRYVREIVLIDGVREDAAGRKQPHLVPLARLDVAEAGTITWDVAATVAGERLDWRDGMDHTPAALCQKLRLLQARSTVRAAATSMASVDAAITRADAAVATGQGERAVAILRDAWADRHDDRLLGAARRALSLDADRLSELHQQGQQHAAAIQQAIAQRHWAYAGAALAQVMGSIDYVASYSPPPDGWAALQTAIDAGMARDTALRESTAQARVAGAQHRWREAADLLRNVKPHAHDPAVALEALRVREQAVLHLVATGATGAMVVQHVQAQIAGVEAQLARTDQDATEGADRVPIDDNESDSYGSPS